MVKKKDDVKKSVALFGDVIESNPSKKEAKKTSRSKKEAEGEDLKKKTSKSTSKTKTAKKDEPGNPTNISISKSRSTTSAKSNNLNASSKPKKEVSKDTGGKSPRPSDTKQKSKTSKRSTAVNTNDTVKGAGKTVKSRQSAKADSNTSETESTSSKRTRVKVKSGPSRDTESPRTKERDNDANEEIFKRAKAHRHKQVRTNVVQGPKQITGKPIPIHDDLVAIVVDGEYLEVSPWSVKNGMYIQGLDSNFLVKYLHYDPVPTKYDELNKKERELI